MQAARAATLFLASSREGYSPCTCLTQVSPVQVTQHDHMLQQHAVSHLLSISSSSGSSSIMRLINMVRESALPGCSSAAGLLRLSYSYAGESRPYAS